MNRTQQSAAIVICLLGLAVLSVGGVFLVREWREEVVERQRLEEENAQLKIGIRKWAAELIDLQRREDERRVLEHARRQLRASPFE